MRLIRIQNDHKKWHKTRRILHCSRFFEFFFVSFALKVFLNSRYHRSEAERKCLPFVQILGNVYLSSNLQWNMICHDIFHEFPKKVLTSHWNLMLNFCASLYFDWAHQKCWSICLLTIKTYDLEKKQYTLTPNTTETTTVTTWSSWRTCEINCKRSECVLFSFCLFEHLHFVWWFAIYDVYVFEWMQSRSTFYIFVKWKIWHFEVQQCNCMRRVLFRCSTLYFNKMCCFIAMGIIQLQE